MLVKLKLQNFQRHEDLELNFTGGLQVIRGQNEAGKSTLFRALAYAWWGSRALPLSLDETVTWGKPVSSLKVTVVFLHNGVEYTIVRSKSGATMTSVLATSNGHAEVTAAVERLFGATASVAQATLMAKQKSFEEGLNSSAITLIEKLSNMGLLDTVILRIQEQLPNGNTKVLESQIAGFEVPKPVLDTAELEATLEAALAQLAAAGKTHAEVKEWLVAVSNRAAEIEQVIASNRRVESEKARLQQAIARCVPVAVPVVSGVLEELKQKADQQEEVRNLRTHFERFKALEAYESGRVPHSHDEVQQKLQEVEAEIAALKSQINTLKMASKVALAKLITETACGLCGKDLSAVPEVQQKNAALQQQAEEADSKVAQLEGTLYNKETQRTLLATASTKSHQQRVKLVGLQYVQIDQSTTPVTVSWIGPAELPTLDAVDWKAEYQAALQLSKQHEEAIKKNEAVAAQKAVYEKELANLVLTPLTAEDEETLSRRSVLEADVALLARNVAQATQACQQARAALETAKAVHATQLAAWETGQRQRSDLEKLLQKTKFHNSIIAKLREARPAVAKELWSLVLTGVSHYFSAIRGTQSVVTRSTDGFLIDGKAIEAYSGSTKDCLGIANRLMLQKTFLPNLSMMLVDEPGAACDESREADLLAMFARCGLDQVILVTHSSIADSFAANVIRV